MNPPPPPVPSHYSLFHRWHESVVKCSDGFDRIDHPDQCDYSHFIVRQKKRRTKLSEAQQDAKVKQVMAAIEENDKLHRNHGRLTRDQILASFDMTGSQLTRWQQRCVLCLYQYASHKYTFSCATPKCNAIICKTCMAYEVTRNLLLKEVYVHQSSFPCTFCRLVGSMDLTLIRAADASRREGLCHAISVHVQKHLKVNDESIVPTHDGVATSGRYWTIPFFGEIANYCSVCSYYFCGMNLLQQPNSDKY